MVNGGLVERTGLRYFSRIARDLPGVVADDEIHHLNERERRELRRLGRGVTLRAFAVGAVSGLCTAFAEIWIRAQADDAFFDSLSGQATFWGVVGGVTFVATAFELAFLYWDALRTVLRMSRAAGLDLFGPHASVKERQRQLARALVRAALELPNPRDSVFGIDPGGELTRLWLTGAMVAYKAKIGLTSFLVKMLLLRLLGRLAVKSWLPFVVVPITGLWNAWVSWRVTQQARIRLMGPSAADALLQVALEPLEGAALEQEQQLELVKTIAGAVLRTGDMHPNLVALLDSAVDQFAMRNVSFEPGRPDALIEQLAAYPKTLQRTALRLYTVAIIIDGKVSAREVALAKRLFACCALPFDVHAIDVMRRDFVSGRNQGAELLRQMVP